jgi:hypothetical protein
MNPLLELVLQASNQLWNPLVSGESYCGSMEWGAGNTDRVFLIIIILISYHNISNFLLPWAWIPITMGIEIQTYKVIGLSVYYPGRIYEYSS